MTHKDNTLLDRVRRLEKALESAVPAPRAGIRPPRPHGGTQLRANVAAAFASIDSMRTRGFAWHEVLRHLTDASLTSSNTSVKQLRSEFAFQRRRERNQLAGAGTAAERGGGTTGRRGPPSRGRTPTEAPRIDAATEQNANSESAQGDEVEAVGTRMQDASAAVPAMIRLADGREYPQGTTMVPVVRFEDWNVITRNKYYGGNVKGKPADVPMVPIEQLLPPRVNSGDGGL